MLRVSHPLLIYVNVKILLERIINSLSQTIRRDAEMTTSRLTLLNIEDLAEQLGVSVATIYRWRSNGESCPPAFKIGGAVRWSQESVDEWLNSQMEIAS